MVESEGDGSEHVLLLVHGAVTFQGCRPLLSQRLLTDRCRVVHYYRRGYLQSSAPPNGFTVADQAADARRVLEGLNVTRAHVLGHSIGALIAMQFALDAPEFVRSLVLVEPTWASRPEILAAFQSALGPVVDAYTSGDRQTAAHLMLRMIEGGEYHQTFDGVFGPGWLKAVASALDLYFQVELPAAVSWTLDVQRARRITQPALVIKGSDTLDLFGMVYEDALSLLPAARGAVLPAATHNVIASNPQLAATLIADFMSCVRS